MKILLFLLAFISFKSIAQNSELSYLDTQNTISSPFSIPVTVNENGEFNLLNNDGNRFSLGLLGQFSLISSKVQYILPIRQDSFSFMDQEKGLKWVEIKRSRFEIGLGLEALMAKSIVGLGLIPFKGSYQIMMREKESGEKKLAKISLPKRLTLLNDWAVGTLGSFQTYGGLLVRAGVGVSYLNPANLSFVFQNQFIVGIKKVNDHQIILSIGEESLEKRKISSDVNLASIEFSRNSGKLFTTQFLLSINDLSHQQLYEQALKGKISALQSALPSHSQKTEWKGSERAFYGGIPGVIGKAVRVGHYDINENGEDQDLDVKIKKNHGVLIPQRNHKRMVYQSDKSVTIFWTSEMKHTHARAMEKNFLSYGRKMGINGFNSDIPTKTNFGSTVTHIGVSFTKDEIGRMKEINSQDLIFYLKEKCTQEELKCARRTRLNKIVEDFEATLRAPWSVLRHDFGNLLGKQPALIYAIVKSLKLDKKVYFKFLSEKYQSMEGTAIIDL